MHKARLKCLSTLVLVLIQEKSVNLVNLSLAFQGHAKPESSYRRIKRFFSEVSLDKEGVARLVLSLLPPPPYTLCVDRTNWRLGAFDINILVIAVAHRGVAFPLVWTLLEKKGNSSSDERIDLLQDWHWPVTLDKVSRHRLCLGGRRWQRAKVSGSFPEGNFVIGSIPSSSKLTRWNW